MPAAASARSNACDHRVVGVGADRARRPRRAGAQRARRRAAARSRRAGRVGVAAGDDQAGLAVADQPAGDGADGVGRDHGPLPGASPRCTRAPTARGSAASGPTGAPRTRPPRRRPAAPREAGDRGSRARGSRVQRAGGERPVADHDERRRRRRRRPRVEQHVDALLGHEAARVERPADPRASAWRRRNASSSSRPTVRANSSGSTDWGATNTSSSRPRMPATNRRTCSP